MVGKEYAVAGIERASQLLYPVCGLVQGFIVGFSGLRSQSDAKWSSATLLYGARPPDRDRVRGSIGLECLRVDST